MNAARLQGDGPSCGGYCRRCGQVHTLEHGLARQAALQLMTVLAREERIDFHLPREEADPRYATDWLFGEAKGKMFGVLVCEDADGRQSVARAFSGQYNGAWAVDGWVPPLFDQEEFYRISGAAENEIQELGRQLEGLEQHSDIYRELAGRRKRLSRELMQKIFNLYTLTNFRGERQQLNRVYLGKGSPPTGTGDCCAPKLLHYAASRGLRPRAIAEFYWGRENSSQSRQHGTFYPACASKCQPVLGFVLCGCDNDGP